MPTYKIYSPTGSLSPKLSAASKLLSKDGVKLATSYRNCALAHGPVLYTTDGVAVIGENSILKYMSGSHENWMVDEMLELERGIREAIKSSSAKELKGCLSELEEHLSNSTSGFLVSNSLSVADISMICTLDCCSESDLKKFSAVTSYHSILSNHPVFKSNQSETQMSLVEHTVFSTVLKMFPQVGDEIFKPTGGCLTQKTKSVKMGHYQCTIALKLFSMLKKKSFEIVPDEIKSGPKGLAQAIIDNLPEKSIINKSKTSVTGPGFIMVQMDAEYLSEKINNFMKAGVKPKSQNGSDVLVDFSSPNIAKEMHVGHLRSTIIGESVCRILEFTGHKTHRINHVGDWGTQFGMLIEYLKCNNATGEIDQSSVGDLTEFYKASKKCFDDDEDFKKRSQLNVVKLQSGDEECKKIWNTLCDVSRQSFEKVYKRLCVTLNECGESFYNPMIPGVIQKFKDAKLIENEEGDAKVVFVDGYQAPLMLQKSDGGFGYDSTDMAALDYRINTLGCDRVIYITDYTQNDHFQMCFKAAKKIGWAGENVELMHIGFGTVLGEDKKRFKTRSGETVKLVDLLDESSRRMEASLRERMSENKANITEEEIKGVADILGYSAVKYFDLHRNPTSNYVFSYDSMLDTKGE